ncbi:asparaginase [Candidatus Woesearchaeota archaeon]|nr:asparaginase [Candidatus Woesearchaeota archaeon]
MKRRICLITTGGTISMSKIEGTLAPEQNNLKNFLNLFSSEADIELVELFNIDSSDIQPENWIKIAETIKQREEDFDGFIISHGTDTMVYTAAALSFLLNKINKPIIITGSQIPITEEHTDAYNNVVRSIKEIESGQKGIFIVFEKKKICGVKAKKNSPDKLDAFIQTNEVNNNKKEVDFNFKLDKNVFLLKLWPGFEPLMLEKLSECKGIVLEAFGCGNIPLKNSFLEKIRELIGKGISIFVSTQCIFGKVDLNRYENGKALLKAGAVPLGDMTSETALVKLMLALGQTEDKNKVKELMLTNVAGEISQGF